MPSAERPSSSEGLLLYGGPAGEGETSAGYHPTGANSYESGQQLQMQAEQQPL